MTEVAQINLAGTLTAEIQAIRDAVKAAANPTDEQRQLEEQRETARREFERLKTEVAAYYDQDKAAMAAYNASRRQLVIDWAMAHDLGYCSSGDHLAPLADLEGLISSGSYVSSGYYETLHGFEYRKTICPDCRHKLRSGPGRYDGEFTQHHTHELKDPSSSLDQLPNNSNLARIAARVGIVLPPEASMDRDTITIGTVKLQTKHY